jgi:hypothetical protein
MTYLRGISIIDNPEEDLSLFEEEDFEFEDDFDLEDPDVLFVEVGIDSEYTDTSYLSLQVAVRIKTKNGYLTFSFFIADNEFEDHIRSNIDFSNYIFQFYFENLQNKDFSPLLYYLSQNLYERRIVNYKKCFVYVYFYYSLKDLNLAFGFNNLLPYYLPKSNRTKNKIVQRRSVTGYFKSSEVYLDEVFEYTIVLKDLYGLDSGGLQNMIKSSGLSDVASESKALLDSYKSQMDVALLTYPLIFIEYSMNDVFVLFDIIDSKLNSFNAIIRDVFKIDDLRVYYTIKTFPLTVGRLVDSLWDKYFRYCFLKNDPVYRLVFNKLSILEATHHKYDFNKDLYYKLGSYNSLEEIRGLEDKEFNKFNPLLKKGVFKYDALNYSSIRFLLESSVNNKLYLLATTSGGRTLNNRPSEYYIEPSFDIDITGAYGNRLLKTELPLGKPRLYCQTSNIVQTDNLKDFLNLHYKRLQKKQLYKIIVSGKLSFPQDLIQSRVISENSIKNKVTDFSKLNVGEQAIKTEFLMLRKEIINGVITSSTLEIIDKVCSNSEKSEIYNLTVNAAIFHYDDDYIENLEEWLEHLLQDQGRLSFSERYNTNMDSRTFKYTTVKLNDLLGPIVKERERLKKDKKPESQAKSTSLKTLINTYWGCLTSVFFNLNNTLISESVTNTTRTNLWLMSKALNLTQNITDGGTYNPMQVTYFKDTCDITYKPGLSALSDFNVYKNHRSIKIQALNNIDWHKHVLNNEPPNSTIFKNIDEYAYNHLIYFWKHYDININFKVEHKIERTPSLKTAYIAKAHYACLVFNPISGKYDALQTTIRGFKNDDSLDYLNPVYHILIAILLDKDTVYIENDGIYQVKKLLKINGWKLSLDNYRSKKPVSKYGPKIEPGDMIILTRKYCLNNHYFFIDDYAEFKKRNNRTIRYEETFEINELETVANKHPIFEKYLHLGIKKTHELMLKNDLRYKPK